MFAYAAATAVLRQLVMGVSSTGTALIHGGERSFVVATFNSAVTLDRLGSVNTGGPVAAWLIGAYLTSVPTPRLAEPIEAD